MTERNRGEMPGVVKFGLGVGIGYGLYRLLGWGGGLGLGRGSQPAPGTTSPAPAPRPRAVQPVEILVKRSPTDPTKAVIEVEGRLLTFAEFLAIIDASGRRDVLVTVAGNTTQQAWNDLRDALDFVGIQISRRLPPSLP